MATPMPGSGDEDIFQVWALAFELCRQPGVSQMITDYRAWLAQLARKHNPEMLAYLGDANHTR
jgi:hypothetical protein